MHGHKLKTNIKITTLQIRMLSGCIISVAILVLCLYAGSTFKYRAEQAIYRETENTARMLITSFEETVELIDTRLSKICNRIQNLDLGLDEEISLETEKKLHDFLNNFSGPDFIAGPGLWNKHGSLIASGIVSL